MQSLLNGSRTESASRMNMFAGRTRKPNYSHEENLVLLEQLELYKDVLFPKGGQPGSSRSRQRFVVQVWSKIVEAVNALPNTAQRTVDELRHRWKDMSHKVRTAIRKQVCSGTLVSKPYPLYFDRILRIMGEEGNISSLFGEDFLTSSFESKSPSGSSSADLKPDVSALRQALALQPLCEVGDAQTASEVGFKHGGDEAESSDATMETTEASCKSSDQIPLNLAVSKLSEASEKKLPDPVPTKKRKASTPRRRGSPSHCLGGGLDQEWCVKKSSVESMVLDPCSERVLQYNHLADDDMGATTFEHVEPPRDTESYTETVENGTARSSVTSTPSTEDLKRKYYLEKISLVQQKSTYYRLQEAKLLMEMELLQRQLSSPPKQSQQMNLERDFARRSNQGGPSPQRLTSTVGDPVTVNLSEQVAPPQCETVAAVAASAASKPIEIISCDLNSEENFLDVQSSDVSIPSESAGRT